MFRTSNPAFRNDAFAPQGWQGIRSERSFNDSLAPAARSTTMTVQGTVIKTGFLTLLAIGSAAGSWYGIAEGLLPAWSTFVGAIGGLVLGLVLSFAPKAAPFLSPVYALLQGVFMGGLSLFVASRFGEQGAALVAQAIGITFAILASLLFAFSAGLIRIGNTLKKVIVIATLGICLFYLASFILSLMGITALTMVHQATPLGIAFSLFVVVLASLNLVLDFQNVEEGVRNNAPKYMEWYCGFALLATLVWLYIEVLRMLAKIKAMSEE